MSFFDIWGVPTDTGFAQLEKKNQPVQAVITYVDQLLRIFAKENIGKGIRNEKGLTQTLVRKLLVNLDDKYSFTFDKEGMEDVEDGRSPAVDIDVIAKECINVKTKSYQRENRFFAFEAKILGVREKYREKEYVIGKDSKGNLKHCGGIERFKRNIHCKELPQAGMIGYVQRNDFNFWFNNINSWIEELTMVEDPSIEWVKEDKLKQKSNKNKLLAKYISNHSRYANTPIKLFHFWVNLN